MSQVDVFPFGFPLLKGEVPLRGRLTCPGPRNCLAICVNPERVGEELAAVVQGEGACARPGAGEDALRSLVGLRFVRVLLLSPFLEDQLASPGMQAGSRPAGEAFSCFLVRDPGGLALPVGSGGLLAKDICRGVAARLKTEILNQPLTAIAGPCFRRQ